MKGYGDNTLKPNNSITKAEALKMTLRLAYPNEDFSSETPWYTNYTDYTQTHFPQLTTNSKDINYTMTRGEIVELIESVLEEEGR